MIFDDEFHEGDRIHVVKEGDTLYKIAIQHDVNLFDLMRLNPYVNVYNLQEGDEILIPAVDLKEEAGE